MASRSSSTSELKEGDEADLIPLSALQHYLYCSRQCALIHIEGYWSENRFTAEGQILHRRADDPRTEKRGTVRTETGLPLRSLSLGITGKADVVEFHATEGRQKEAVFPVEYKRGQPKGHDADEVQLCAQALCLEEMLDTHIPEGALFYGRNRRRRGVSFEPDLRERTRETARQTRFLIASGRTPPPTYSAKLCDQCSLLTICNPQPLTSIGSVRAWLQQQIEE